MPVIRLPGRGKTFLRNLFILLVTSVLLAAPGVALSAGAGAPDSVVATVTGTPVYPAAAQDSVRPGLAVPGPPAVSSGNGIAEELGLSRPYYAPEVEHASSPEGEGEEALERIAQRLPAELLPQSLLPRGKGAGGAAGEEGSSTTAEAESAPATEDGDFTAAGTGGWAALTRPYLPAADPSIYYGVSSYSGVLDGSGRMHFIYGKSRRTDISLPPDGAGFRLEYLQDILYCTYAGGAWDVPRNITSVSSPCSSTPVFYEVDDRGYLHIVFTAWIWGRDSTRPAGEYGAYQHEQENLWYRYISPDGFMSDPRRLTDFSGSWGLQGANFTLRGNRLCGVYTAVRNNETAPSSYRAVEGFVEGYLDAWQPAVQLAAWDFNDDPGQLQPQYWPSIDVSGMGGEVTVVYGVRTVSPILFTAKIDVYGCVRGAGAGAVWSTPRNISSAAGNEGWLPLFVFYRDGADFATACTFRMTMARDAAHPPREDAFLIYQYGGVWQAPANITRVAAQQDGSYFNLDLDSLQNLHFCYMVASYAWTGASWEPQGADLRYTRETGAGLSAPATILTYSHQRYFQEITMAMDRDGNSHVLFSAYMYDGVTTWNNNIGHATNAPGGDPGSFTPPTLIRPNTAYSIYGLTASAFPDGDVLASWFERGFDGGGNPVYGRMYSRHRDGDTWGDALVVSSVPGSSDILHVEAAYWPSHENTTMSDTGEQQAVFETAKYDIVGGTWYDFRKYFTETVNGVWTTPQLIAGGGLSGGEPALYADGGQRYFVLYTMMDPATGKDLPYATRQPEPSPPASTYFFAEGTTRDGFEEWLCIQNAGEEETTVTITYMLETGINVDQVLPVPAHSRMTVNVNEAVGPEHDVSARVAADGFIVAERPMYFRYGPAGWTGGHCVIGARNTSRRWFFAEGTTRGGFAEYLTLQNPSDEVAHVDITYVLGGGTTVPGALDIAPRSRATVDVNSAVGPEQDVSLVVESDTAVVAERPMYFDYRGMTGGHCEVGSTSLSQSWYFAEGCTRSGFDTYICLQNPFAVDAVANLTFVLEDGTTVPQPVPVPATSRQTLRVNDVVGPGRDVSTVVESDSLLLVERPMYFLYGGTWPGGHVAAGVRAPKNTWFFAEGTTRAGFQEWLSLQNPGEVDANVTLSLLLDGGTVRDVGVSVPAHSRTTVAVHAIVEPERDISVVVKSDRAIVAERPMYFLYRDKWPGGHVVPGL
ncbi:MAG: DUF5719 family protein [Actinomycetota bacterium]